MPTVTLCMIVKNVEGIIAPCLNSAKKFVDEIIIVDTGSTDGTRAMLNATLADFPGPKKFFDFNQDTHPKGFLLDVKETWDDKIPGPFTGEYMLADFGAARQYGWDKATSDYIIWLDSDDVLESGENLKGVLENMAASRIDTAMVNYDYASDHLGNVTCCLYRERITRRGGSAKWDQPVHEVLGLVGAGRFYSEINVKHQRQKYRSAPLQHHRNLKILTKWFEGKDKTDPNVDPRMLFYLAMEERFIWPERAIETFRAYCARSGWDEERGLAHQLSGWIWEQKSDLNSAISEYAQSAMDFYWNPDPWFSAARIAYFRKNWGKCIEYTERGFAVAADKSRPCTLPYDPLDRTYRPYIFYSAALVSLEQFEKVVETCKKVLERHQNDPHIKGNVETAEKKIAEKKGQMSQNISFDREESLEAPAINVPKEVLLSFAIQMWKQISESEPKLACLHIAANFLDNLPFTISTEQKISEAKELTHRRISGYGKTPEVMPEVTPRKEPTIAVGGARKLLKIGIWTGWAWEPWNPNSVKTGIGGSETAAIYMARELAKLGHHVQAYSACDGAEGVYDGVEYIHWQKAWDNPDSLNHDILIVSRQTKPLHHFKKVKAKILWVHDIHVGTAAEVGDSFEKVDAVLTLSDWHREYFYSVYPHLRKSGKVHITRNGIDIARFAAEPKKEGNRLIYTSSPDRGLENLLKLFPRIQKEVPDAELHVYYGFETWKSMAKASNSIASQRRIAAIENALNNTPGVFYHGRVGQHEIAEAFLKSKVWAYPTNFTETSCITAMEAQAAGCVPVTTALAALNETVRSGILLPGPNDTEDYEKGFVSYVVNLLKDEELRGSLGTAGRKVVSSDYGWDTLAPEWETLFAEVLEKKAKEIRPGRVFYPASTYGFGQAKEMKNFDASPVKTVAPVPQAVAPATDKPTRIAVILGKLGAAVHGKMDIDRLFDSDGSFVTGTVSGFFNIAWGLGERGHVVDAFCDAKEKSVGSRFGGVNFYPLDGNTIDGTYDAYVSINEPDVLRPFPREKLKVCAMWLNDFSYCTPGWDEFVDVYACPSRTHLDYIAATTATDRGKMDVVPLSVNAEFYNKAVKRKPFSMAYCSSPDRGLHVLLEIFPEIRRRVPQAELKIYYRFKPWLDQMLSDSSQIRNPSYERALSINDSLIRLGQKGENGVTLVGPLPPRRLIDELRATWMLAYPCSPTRFTEGFSASVMDACMAGCVPVVAGVDALSEVYAGAVHLIHGDPMTMRDEWVEAICLGLTDEGFASEIRMRAQAHAIKFTRQKVAEQWENLLRKGKTS